MKFDEKPFSFNVIIFLNNGIFVIDNYISLFLQGFEDFPSSNMSKAITGGLFNISYVKYTDWQIRPNLPFRQKLLSKEIII